MAQDITLLGASYSTVPAVTLPKTGGGTASFTDVSDTTAAAADVASGKYFYTSAGVRTAGTNSGGGGGSPTLLATLSLGTISTSSTTATNTGQSISVSGINDYDLLIVETSVDSIWVNRHMATVKLIWLTADSTIGTKNAATIATATWNCRNNSSSTVTTRASTTAYGIYPYSCSISNGTATIPMYQRYNNTQTGTINNAYTTRVYGVKCYDLIGG